MQAGVVAATIAQAGAIGNQGGSSNLQRFEAHDPPTLKGGKRPNGGGSLFLISQKGYGC